MFTTNARSLSCLLCAQSARDPRFSRHAEARLLKLIQSWNLDPNLNYTVTCFLSWSPCADCAQRLAEFLQKNRHVSLNLYASRIYSLGQYERGLCTLSKAGASIAIMTARGQCGPPAGRGRGEGRERPWGLLRGKARVVSLGVALVGCLRRGGHGAWTAEDSRVAEKREVSAGHVCAEGQGEWWVGLPGRLGFAGRREARLAEVPG